MHIVREKPRILQNRSLHSTLEPVPLRARYEREEEVFLPLGISTACATKMAPLDSRPNGGLE